MGQAEAELELLDAVASVAADLPGPIIDAVCSRLEVISDLTQADRDAVAAALPQPGARRQIDGLINVWQRARPGAGLAELAWALRGAAAAIAHARESQSLELVWTGPAAPGSALRRTDQVLLDLISGARDSLCIAVFTAYRIPDVARALLASAGRGVRITLILESAVASSGKVSFESIEGLGAEVAGVSEVYVWPMDQRERDANGHYGSLHVKCALADDARLLVSSANLTGHALNLNMELGVLITGGSLPRQVGEHLRGLVRGEVLRRVSAMEHGHVQL